MTSSESSKPKKSKKKKKKNEVRLVEYSCWAGVDLHMLMLMWRAAEELICTCSC